MTSANDEPVTDWRVGFYAAVVDWLNRTLPEKHADWDFKTVVSVLSVEEALDRGFCGSDVTAGDDPEVDLRICWIDIDGARQNHLFSMFLTDLMKELT